MVKPWADAGAECYCVDIQHSIRRERVEGNIHFVWGDVRTWTPPPETNGRIVILFAFPPCTDVTNSDARDFRIKGTALLRDALEIFSACEHAAKWCGVPYMVENPRGQFSRHMGPPDETFNPWEYGDPWTKETHLWTGNGFVMPTPTVFEEPLELDRGRIHKASPGDGRANFRSETPPGFARQVFNTNQAVITEYNQRWFPQIDHYPEHV